MSNQLYAITRKDANGRFTVQCDELPTYNSVEEPVFNPRASSTRITLRYLVGDERAEAISREWVEGETVKAQFIAAYGEAYATQEMSYYGGKVPYWFGEPVKLSALVPDLEFRMLPWRDRNWRGVARYLVSDYPLPWSYEPIVDHFAHLVFETDKATGASVPMVAYYASPDHGEIRRTTKMKPGRYLTQFYPALDGETVREWATKLDKGAEIKFAVSADDIEKVYLNGPSSCMSHPADDYDSCCHPVRVYGDSDLQLAFLSYQDVSDDGFRASARALVWPSRKVYGRIYGDTHRMTAALKAAGYTDGSLKGAAIQRIYDEDREQLVCPYIDGTLSVTDHGTHLTIGGNIAADSTCGLIEVDQGTWCDGLEDYVNDDADDFVYVRGIGNCSPSYVEENCFLCDHSSEYFHNDEMVCMADGSVWAQRYFDREGGFCERTEENYPADELVTLEDTGETVCQDWADNNAHHIDGNYYASKPDEEPEAVAA